MDNASPAPRYGLPGWVPLFFEAVITRLEQLPRRHNPKGVWKFSQSKLQLGFCPAELDAQLAKVSANDMKKLLRAHLHLRQTPLPTFPSAPSHMPMSEVLAKEINLYKRGASSRTMQKSLRSKLKRLEAENKQCTHAATAFTLAANTATHFQELRDLEHEMHAAMHTCLLN